jgi:hypothetical protein
MTVEPPATADMSPTVDAVLVRDNKRLRQDLAQALDITPSDADDWIDEHGRVNAEERIRSHWTDSGFYRSDES